VKTPAGHSAETLALVALVFQALGAAFVFLLIALLVPAASWAGFAAAPFGLFLIAVAFVTALLLYVGYDFSYRRIQLGDYQGAEAATLVLGILLLFPTIVPGILYLVAYGRLGEAQRERWWMPQAYGGATPWPTPGPPGYPAGNAPLYPPICPRCGSASTFIPVHQRFFCYACRTYL
jgi:hypothetical protein